MDTTAAGPTVGSVAARPELGLRVLAGAGQLDRPVTTAHVSELVDPAPWLHGGELLMTTGLQLGTGAADLDAYVDRLAAAGVACLALGTGARLTHEQVPPALVAAAERAALPLLEVPERTPFLAVTETVFAHVASARYAEQVRALEAQRALTAAAVHPGGVAAVATALATLTGLDVLVADATALPLAASPDAAAAALRADLVPGLDRLRAHGLRASTSVQQPGRDVRVHPLGAQRLRGFLVCAGVTVPGPYERQLVAGAVSLLTLELERRHRAGDAERRRRGTAARALLQEPVSPAAAADLLRSVGLAARSLRVVTLRVPAADAGVLAAHVELLEASLPTVLASSDDPGLVLVLDPPPDLATVVQRAVAAEGGRATAGVGGPVPPADAARSARQARRAADVAAGTPGRVVDVLALASTKLLLASQAPDAVTAYADAVLGPLDQAGRAGTLLPSLRAFLESNGSWEDAAARLGIHRHTLRQRLRRVEELTGRRLDSGHDRMELLLAFDARDVDLLSG
jgi:PucR family transcriptional regulator, purine catabolism regulatory protein